MSYTLAYRVAASYSSKKLLAPLALAMGLGGCAENLTTVNPTKEVPRAVVEDDYDVDLKYDIHIPTAKLKTDPLLKNYDKHVAAARNSSDIKRLRAAYGAEFDSILQKYYKGFDNLPEKMKRRSLASFTLLEKFILSQRDIVFKKLDEEYLKYKPHLRERYENRKAQ